MAKELEALQQQVEELLFAVGKDLEILRRLEEPVDASILEMLTSRLRKRRQLHAKITAQIRTLSDPAC